MLASAGIRPTCGLAWGSTARCEALRYAGGTGRTKRGHTALPMIETPIKQQFLSDSEADNLRRSFADNGFVVIRNAIPRTSLADLAASILSEFERQKQSGELFRGGGLVSGHLNAFTGAQSRFVYETLQERGII